MRTVLLHFAGVSHAEVSQALRDLGALEQPAGPWIIRAAGEPVLYVNWFRDYDELSTSEWRELERQIGTGPELSISVDVSGRVAGVAEVRSLSVSLLRSFRGAAQDDHSAHAWSLGELERDATVDGKGFFVGPR